MAQRRKLQVFVSSTYTDLINERQAAVGAILTAGHIPAGMELFAGQNEEQMNIIKRWINESDLYLLLLGGRYGSIEEASGKSYTHLEFEYAKSVGKTVFAVVAKDSYIENRVKDEGPNGVMELAHRTEYLNFKKEITGKYVNHWDSLPTLQLAVINTLHVLEDDETLVGWVRGSEAIDSGVIAEQIARLTKDNEELRTQLVLNNKTLSNTSYQGLTFKDTCALLNQFKIEPGDINDTERKIFVALTLAFGDVKPSILHVFYWLQFPGVAKQGVNIVSPGIQWTLQRLAILGLITLHDTVFNISPVGHEFGLRLQLEYNVQVSRNLDVQQLKLFNNGSLE